ncbi:MAG: hypothetical protein VX475_07350, partial [Myxococcota bacterium]|nr:hypothetical protein [Myxococcota bacterium]
MKLTLAGPEDAAPISQFYQTIHDDTFSHQEMFSASTVEQLLADGELAVVVASDNRRIVGCGLGFPQLWNQSLELGALSVDNIEN